MARVATLYLDFSTTNAYPVVLMDSFEPHTSLVVLDSLEIIQGDALQIHPNTSILPRLELASFTDCCIEDVKAALLLTMFHSPHLETLHLLCLSPIVVLARRYLPPRLMAQLTSLLVEHTYFGLLIDLCKNHEMPRLRELTIACLGDEPDDDEDVACFSLPQSLRNFVRSSVSIILSTL